MRPWGLCLLLSEADWFPGNGGDNRANQFLIQKVAINVQCASVMAAIPSTQDWAEFAFLPSL